MKKVSKLKNILLAMAVLSTASFAGDEFKFLPIFLDDNWDAKVEVAAVIGSTNFDRDGINSGVNYGLDLSFECPVFTLAGKHHIRQQLTLSRYDKNDYEVTVIEMNPYYFFDISKDLTLGVGPGIGAMNAKMPNGNDEWLFTVQSGAGLKYYMDNNILIGADIRYQWTAEKSFGTGVKQDLDNMRVLLKVGYAY
ncbi:MAG: hypothetical protein COB17_01715 [Sulfurimonas sp.]|nr:MAG: hypothetical protein COB17_01715 [Sulfurimonas sp.]